MTTQTLPSADPSEWDWDALDEPPERERLHQVTYCHACLTYSWHEGDQCLTCGYKPGDYTGNG